MDGYDPTERPSIFSRPELDDERPTDAVHRPQPSAPIAEPQTGWSRPSTRMAPETGRPSARLLVGLGLGALVMLVIAVLVASALSKPEDSSLVGASASPTTAPSGSSTPNASLSPAETTAATPVATSTPTATTTPPPQQGLATGGWARVSVPELNVRSDPRTAATVNYRLVRGAAAYIAEGPVSADGFDWYRIVSLGGARGWAASGSPESEFMAMVEDSAQLAHCGRVPPAVLHVEEGSVRPHDPIHIGDLALPASAFDELELGALELVRSIDGEACIGAEIGADGEPRIDAEFSATACGLPGRHPDGTFRLQPAVGQDVTVDYQAKVPAIVHPAVVTSGSADDPMSLNLRAVFMLKASEDGVAVCVHARVSERENGRDTFRMVDGNQCVVVEEHTDERVVIRPASEESRVELLMTAGSTPPGSVLVGVPTELNVTAVVAESQSIVSLTGQLTEGCR